MLGIGAVRRWRTTALVSGLAASAVMVGCTISTGGTPTADTGDARSYRSWAADSSSQSAASARERESTLQESLTAEAVADACNMLSSTSVDAVTAINAYVNAATSGNDTDVAGKAQAAVETLNHAADSVSTTLGTELLPQMADSFRAWVEAARGVAKAIGERYAQPEFNAEVDKFNRANDNALDTCGGSH
ncbi:MAG TPA: hypothetical protein VH496_14480 [Mycobacterium sp.]